MPQSALKTQPFSLKGRMFTCTVLQLTDVVVDELALYLQEAMAKAPKMFENMPVVLDLSSIKNDEYDLKAMYHTLRQHDVFPIAVQHATPFHATVALSLGLPTLHASSTGDKDCAVAATEPSLPVVSKTHNKLTTTPVRSGQQMVCKEGDLTIISSVGHGAEVLAEGNIHVYGALRGRALAGISGNKQARIFCQSLDAELVSIAGVYRLSDAMAPCEGPCQIYLKNNAIYIEPLC